MSIANLASALVKAQAQFQTASKDKNNTFFRSKYADLSSVAEAIKGPLADNGLAYVQISHDKDNAAAIETLILHASGEQMSCGVVSVPVSKGDAQGYGSAMTYARRYSLSAAFGVVTAEDDDGNAAAVAKPAAKPNTPTQQMKDEFALLTPDMQTWIQDLAADIERLFANEGAEQAYAHMIEQLPDQKTENERHNNLKMALATQMQKQTKSALKDAADQLRKSNAAAK